MFYQNQQDLKNHVKYFLYLEFEIITISPKNGE